jgi:Fe-S-cluster containining protein
LRAIAKFLQIPIKEAVKKFFVVDARSEGGTKFCFPAKTTQVDICGTYIPWRRTYDKGYCIFYDVNKHLCSIYPVLPKFAKDFNCWIDETEEQVKAASNEVIGSWEHVDWTEFVNDPNGLNNSRDED